MMHVVDQRDSGRLADWKQILGRIGLIVVFDGQSAADPGRKPIEVTCEIRQRLRFVAISPAAMDIDDIGPDPFRDFRLIFKFLYRLIHDVRAG